MTATHPVNSTTCPSACTRCGLPSEALIHNATANGHDYTSPDSPWWRTAPNPPCVSWCEDVHAPGEFNFGGGFLCRKEIARTADFVVEVQSYMGIDEDATPGVYEADPAAVWAQPEGGRSSIAGARADLCAVAGSGDQ